MAYHNLAELHWQGDGPAPSLTLNGRGLDLAVRRGLGMSALDWLRANRARLSTPVDGTRRSTSA